MCVWTLFALMIRTNLRGPNTPQRRAASRDAGDCRRPSSTGQGTNFTAATKRRRSSQRKASEPPPVIPVRPPRWQVVASKCNPHRASLDQFKERQLTYLNRFKADAAAGNWAAIHRAHFDWWMFPIDDGSQIQYNLLGEHDVQELRADPEWHERYLESFRIVAQAWAWDVEKAQRLPSEEGGKGWTKWTASDVRLAKMIRSLWLFEEKDYMESLQAFAHDLKANEKEGKPFTYGHTVLDEILFMTLPRRVDPVSPLSPRSPKAPAQFTASP